MFGSYDPPFCPIGGVKGFYPCWDLEDITNSLKMPPRGMDTPMISPKDFRDLPQKLIMNWIFIMNFFHDNLFSDEISQEDDKIIISIILSYYYYKSTRVQYIYISI